MPPIVPALCIEVGYYMRHGHFLTLKGGPCPQGGLFSGFGLYGPRTDLGLVPGVPGRGYDFGGVFGIGDLSCGLGHRKGTTCQILKRPLPLQMPSGIRAASGNAGSRAFLPVFCDSEDDVLPICVCIFVVAWYVLFSSLVRRRCRYYLDRRFPGTQNPFKRLWQDYRRVVALGGALIDRAAFGMFGAAGPSG